MTDTQPGSAPALPFSSNVNWTQLVGLLATLLALFGIRLDPATQAAAVTAIVGLTAVATWVLHTFVNHPSNVAAAQTLVADAVNAAKKTAPALAAFALAALATTGLGGCSTLENAAASLAANAVSSTPVPGQAKTVFAAKLTFDFLVEEAQNFVDSGLATSAQKAQIRTAVATADSVVNQAETAAENGDNAAVAAALAAMNAQNLSFSQLLAKLGIGTAPSALPSGS